MTLSMIDKATAIETVMERLKKLPQGHALDMRTYKRNRSVLIRRVEDDLFEVIQNGYEQNRFESTRKKMKKLLKTLLKKEFPRSTKIRLYTLEGENAETHLPRKIL